MKNESFMDILHSNDEDSIKKFLQANGKVKPYSPVYFIPSQLKGEKDNGERDMVRHGRHNRRPLRS